MSWVLKVYKGRKDTAVVRVVGTITGKKRRIALGTVTPKASDFERTIAFIYAPPVCEMIAQPGGKCKCSGINMSFRRLYSPASSVATRVPFSIGAAALNRTVLPGWAEEDAPPTLCSVNNRNGFSRCSRVV